MEIKAKVIGVLPLETGESKKGKWEKGSVIVKYQDGDYQTTLCLQNMKRAKEFIAIPVGSSCTFFISPHSNEYRGKWYTSVDCYNWWVNRKQEPDDEVGF